MLRLEDDVVAFAVDEALATVLTLHEVSIAKSRQRGAAPDGTTWATAADYDDDLPAAPIAVAYPELLEVDDGTG